MAYQKLQGRRAINVYPQDGVVVPSPSDKIVSGSNTSVVANELVDSGADFASKNIKAGFTVYNTTTGKTASVTSVSDTSLTLSSDIFLASPNDYVVYGTGNSEGPVLYVGFGGSLSVITVGGDTITLQNVGDSSFIPIMVSEVLASTTCANIIALW